MGQTFNTITPSRGCGDYPVSARREKKAQPPPLGGCGPRTLPQCTYMLAYDATLDMSMDSFVARQMDSLFTISTDVSAALCPLTNITVAHVTMASTLEGHDRVIHSPRRTIRREGVSNAESAADAVNAATGPICRCIFGARTPTSRRKAETKVVVAKNVAVFGVLCRARRRMPRAKTGQRVDECTWDCDRSRRDARPPSAAIPRRTARGGSQRLDRNLPGAPGVDRGRSAGWID